MKAESTNYIIQKYSSAHPRLQGTLLSDGLRLIKFLAPAVCGVKRTVTAFINYHAVLYVIALDNGPNPLPTNHAQTDPTSQW